MNEKAINDSRDMIAMIKRLDLLVYLATPYSKYPHGCNAAHIEACRIAGRLMQEGVNVLCQVAHSHSVAIHTPIDPLDELFYKQGIALLDRCSMMIVATMQGYEESRGIAEEIKFCKRKIKPFVYLDPKTMLVSASPPDHPFADLPQDTETAS